jgi:putative membrane protein
MSNLYYGYYFWGMNLVWWFIWIIFLIWMFAAPYDFPGQMKKKDTPLDILNNRLASGAITNEEYQERKKILGTI